MVATHAPRDCCICPLSKVSILLRSAVIVPFIPAIAEFISLLINFSSCSSSSVLSYKKDIVYDCEAKFFYLSFQDSQLQVPASSDNNVAFLVFLFTILSSCCEGDCSCISALLDAGICIDQGCSFGSWLENLEHIMRLILSIPMYHLSICITFQI